MLGNAKNLWPLRKTREPEWPKLRLLPPDLVESRANRRLLLWGDLPRWMVVDREFHDLLNLFNQRPADVPRALDALRPAERKTVAKSLADLLQAGVLHDQNQANSAAPQPAAKAPRIENISVNLTHRCNLRCSFCYYLEDLNAACDGELTAQEIVAFLESTRPLLADKPSLALLGGEPMLCPDKLLDVARYAVKNGFDVLISTNGLAVTPEFAAAAQKLKLQVQVSLDDSQPAGHDACRGHGAFDRALQGVKTLVDAGAHTIISMICHAENLDRIEQYYDLALALGVNEARFIPLKRIGGARRAGPAPAPVSRIIARAAQMLERRPEFLKLMGRDCFSILAASCQIAARRRSCGVGAQTLLLDADGALYPCLNTNRREFRFGDIREPDFDFPKLWRQSPVLQDLRRRTDIDLPGQACAQCPVRYWCLGYCRGETHAQTERLSGPSPACRDMRRAWLDIMWIAAQRPEWIVNARPAC